MKELWNKVAVITGAAEGIGKAIAIEAARRGMKLVLADLNGGSLKRTADELAAQGVELVTQVANVAEEAELEQLAGLAFQHFGAVHLLVNNAGVALARTAWETSRRDWDWVMGVNLYGVTNSLRAFVPRMLDSGQPGHIVNVASIAGMLAEPGLAAYNASKFAVVAVSESLQHDLTLRGAPLAVSVLCPGWVKTRIADAERHRAPGERTDLGKLDDVTLKIGSTIRKAVEAGISAEQVAAAVFEAVDKERFYILTHPRTLAGIKIRMEDILNNRQPTLLPL